MVTLTCHFFISQFISARCVKALWWRACKYISALRTSVYLKLALWLSFKNWAARTAPTFPLIIQTLTLYSKTPWNLVMNFYWKSFNIIFCIWNAIMLYSCNIIPFNIVEACKVVTTSIKFIGVLNGVHCGVMYFMKINAPWCHYKGTWHWECI